MSRAAWNKLLIASLILLSFALCVGNSPTLIGQEGASAKTEKKARGRLPMYYADIVTEQQREKIYAVQKKYQDQINALNEQMLELVKKENDEVEAILTAEQKEKLEKAKAEGIAKKKKKAADRKADAAAKSATPAASPAQ